MKIKVEELKNLAKKAIVHYGYTEEETNQILDVLLYAQLRGNNQGVIKLIGPGIPKPKDLAEMEIEKQTKVSALINAHRNPAMIVLSNAADIAITKAKETGVGIVGINHIDTSSGALGYYAKKIAKEGLVAFVFAEARPTVAAHGSYEPIFGTNPMAIGVPSDNEPLVLDMATAAMTNFGVIEANTAGKLLPKDTGYDKDGNVTNVPSKIIDGGSLRTFDNGHKGSGLAMMVQILAGPLVGAAFMGLGDKDNINGHLILAIDPEILGGLSVFKKSVSQMIEKVKSTKKISGVQEILMPSERGDTMTQKVLKTGEIEIEDNLFHELKKIAEK